MAVARAAGAGRARASAAVGAASRGRARLVDGAFHVLVQVRLLLEALAADAAGVRPLVAVHGRLVAREAVSKRERLPAAGALARVRFVPVVNAREVLVQLPVN